MAKKQSKEITNKEEALAAIEKTYENLKYVPENIKTAEVCNAAIAENGAALEWVPEKLKTAKLCLAAIKGNGYALSFVPDKFKTAKLCLTAVGEWGAALEFVPEELKTLELCITAVSKAGENLMESETMTFVPKSMKGKVEDHLKKKKLSKPTTEEEAIAAVKEDANIIETLPSNLLTSRVICEAVAAMNKTPYYVFQLLPLWFYSKKDEKTKNQIFLDALKQNAGVIKELSRFSLKKELTEELFIDVAERYPKEVFRKVLEFIPDKFKTEKVCLAAVKGNNGNINYVPEKLKEVIMKKANIKKK